jgi:hypothetical protein
MKEYVVNFTLFTFRQKETVTAENVFKAQAIIEEKYGKENVKISSVASALNQW